MKRYFTDECLVELRYNPTTPTEHRSTDLKKVKVLNLSRDHTKRATDDLFTLIASLSSYKSGLADQCSGEKSSMRGRVALITGAAQGIGKAIGERLLQTGARVGRQL